MRILFLGTSAATSFPLAFCRCRVCEKARINKGKDIRKRSSVIINDDMLIDFGPDVVTSSNMYNIDLTNVRYILQTHGHSDHFDAGHLITRLEEYAAQNVNPVCLAASEETFKSLDRRMKAEDPNVDLFDPDWLRRLNIDIRFICSGDHIKMGEYSVTAIESLHDINENSLIYIISQNDKSILYGTDLVKISTEAWEILKMFRLDLVILDHTYGKGFNSGGHLDAGQVVDIIAKMKEEKIIHDKSMVYATHISHEGNDTHDIMEGFAARSGYHIAYDGLEIKI
jgi:phosphoribosyl 1,2-cyclic phosphate phosphodiesterase